MFTDAESQLILFRLKQRNCKLYNCRQQKSSRRFCETLNIDELNCGFYRQNHAFFFLEYIFQFLINKVLSASNSVHRQNFMGKNVKDN